VGKKDKVVTMVAGNSIVRVTEDDMRRLVERAVTHKGATESLVSWEELGLLLGEIVQQRDA